MRNKQTLHFWREDYGEKFEDSKSFEVFDDSDIEYCAEKYAEHYHNNRDGWEASWPIEFSISKPDGTFLGKVSVERESQPCFYGRRI